MENSEKPVSKEKISTSKGEISVGDKFFNSYRKFQDQVLEIEEITKATVTEHWVTLKVKTTDEEEEVTRNSKVKLEELFDQEWQRLA